VEHDTSFAAIPFICGVVGSVAVGRVCDILSRRGFSAINSFKIPIVGAGAGEGISSFLYWRHTGSGHCVREEGQVE
jgi:hypothetical protein